MISSRYNCTGAIVIACRMVLLVLAGVGLIGCSILIPTPSIVGYSEITNKTIESLEPGKTTRADVLLKLGEPGERLKNDRIFVYHWQQVASFGMIPTALGGSMTNDHYLAFEFGPDNQLKRVKEFSGDWVHPVTSPSRNLGQWASEKPGSPH
jgi:outer membrane protein assembly factor BamE (lipoprotein component of BamABCDE complex)